MGQCIEEYRTLSDGKAIKARDVSLSGDPNAAGEIVEEGLETPCPQGSDAILWQWWYEEGHLISRFKR
jgi:hypothetical protein